MMKKNVCFIFLIFCFFILISINSAVIDAREGRYYFETENFIVNFNREHEKTAYKAAEIAEDIHDDLVEFMNYKPPRKTHIIINDKQDTANAAAAPFYFNRIYINLRQPDIYSGFVGKYEDFLRLLLVHEYTHILHLDMNFGPVRNLRRVLGKIPLLSTPNFLLPYWMIEGYAMYAETEFTTGGRGSNDLNNMHLRTSAAENRLYRIDQVHGPYDLGSWPSGGRSIYYYGLSIFEYIAEEYGEDKMVEISHEFSRNPGQNINRIFLEILGDDIDQVYEDWKRDINRTASNVAREIDRDLAFSERLTTHGWMTMNPSAAAQTGHIAYYHYGELFPSLRLIDDDGNHHLVSLNNPAGEGLDWSLSGEKIVYPELNYYSPSEIYYDIYIYDVVQKGKKRITEGQRAYSPQWVDEENIIYIKQSQGLTDLVIKNLETGKTEVLLEGTENITFSQLDFSFENNKVLMSVWTGGQRDIYYFDLKTDEMVPVLVDNHINIHPSWTPQGDTILFSSDRTERFNLFAYELQSGKIYQITDKFTGAFEPQYSKSRNEIIFVGYSEEGYDIYAVDYNPGSWKEPTDIKALSFNSEMNKADNKVEHELRNENQNIEFSSIIIDDPEKNNHSDEKDTAADSEYEALPYNPFLTMWPRYWIPSFQYTYYNGESEGYLGLRTGGIDALQNHQYQLDLRFDSRVRRPQMVFNYSYERDRTPHFFSQLVLSTQNIFSQGEFKEVRENYAFLLGLPLKRGYFAAHNLYAILNFSRVLGQTEPKRTHHQLTISPGWQMARVWGKNNFTHNLSTNIEYTRDLFQEQDNNALETNLRYAFSWNDKNEIATRVFGGYNELQNYRIGGLNKVRSFSRQLSQQTGVFNLEYRRELHRINSGAGHLPLFFKSFNGALFYDYAYMFDREEDKSMNALGIEISLEMSELYGRMTDEIVLGVNESGFWYFRVGKFF